MHVGQAAGLVAMVFLAIATATPLLAQWLMPTRRWVAIYVGLMAAVHALIWVLDDKSGEWEYGLLSVAFMVTGSAVALGAVGRLIALELKDRGVAQPLVWLSQLAPAAVAAGVAFGAMSWRAQPPSADCADRTFELGLAGRTYRVPAGAPFAVGYLEQGKQKSASLFMRRDLKAFCRAAAAGSMELSALSVVYVALDDDDFTDDAVHPARADRYAHFCKATAGQSWAQRLCRPNANADRFPRHASLTAWDGECSRSFGCTHLDLEQDLADAVARAQTNGKVTIETTRAADFVRHDVSRDGRASRRYLVADPAQIRSADGAPVVVSCGLDEPDERPVRPTRCNVTYKLTEALVLTYAFEAPVDDLPAAALEADRLARLTFRELEARR